MTRFVTPVGDIVDNTVNPPQRAVANVPNQRTTPAFAAAPIPDATVATIWEPGAATAGVTWGVPTNAAAGQYLTLITTQDGVGGRAVAYNAIYKTGGGAAIVTTASTKNIDLFYYDGTNWRLVSRTTGQAV